jgi:hypothetical protein
LKHNSTYSCALHVRKEKKLKRNYALNLMGILDKYRTNQATKTMITQNVHNWFNNKPVVARCNKYFEKGLFRAETIRTGPLDEG